MFLEEAFNMPDRFTKYVFVEEISVFFIRTHHINFVRLYNKNKKYLTQLKETAGQNQDKLNLNHQNSLELCKWHLKCINAIAKHRTQETR